MSLVHEVEDLSFLPPERRELATKLRKWISSHFPNVKVKREKYINEKKRRKFYECIYEFQRLSVRLCVSDECVFSPLLIKYYEYKYKDVHLEIYKPPISENFELLSFNEKLGSFSTIEEALAKIPLPII